MAIEIVDFPSYIAWWIFPVRYVKLPEGNMFVTNGGFTWLFSLNPTFTWFNWQHTHTQTHGLEQRKRGVVWMPDQVHVWMWNRRISGTRWAISSCIPSLQWLQLMKLEMIFLSKRIYFAEPSEFPSFVHPSNYLIHSNTLLLQKNWKKQISYSSFQQHFAMVVQPQFPIWWVYKCELGERTAKQSPCKCSCVEVYAYLHKSS